MKSFLSYVEHLHNIVSTVLANGVTPALANSIDIALDGEPSKQLRSTVKLSDLRRSGIFFTPSHLRNALAERTISTLSSKSVVVDIACGVGDLFIGLTPKLGKGGDLSSTLELWGKQLIGHDIFMEFVNAAKLRLVLAGILQGHQSNIAIVPDLDLLFPGITARNGLLCADSIERATHIIMNPPYTKVTPPQDCTWASGKVNAAAVFVDFCVSNASNGTKLVAILPDVLRSGSNYKKWRSQLEAKAEILETECLGQFDKHADVDVFILELEVRRDSSMRDSKLWEPAADGQHFKVRGKFSVHVGAVVEYRDPHEGKTYPYLTPQNAPPWATIWGLEKQRRFSGATFTPPFVVVRRTSRKGDRYRAVPTVVDMSEPVAVENHLLVLIPHSGELGDCYELVEVLKMEETSSWLNQRISCRHLTVSALADLPWWERQ